MRAAPVVALFVVAACGPVSRSAEKSSPFKHAENVCLGADPAGTGAGHDCVATLGRLHERGHGVDKDLTRARSLYESACGRGEPL